MFPYVSEYISTYKRIVVLKRTVSHSHTCLLSTYYAVVGLGESERSAQKSVVLALKELTGP